MIRARLMSRQGPPLAGGLPHRSQRAGLPHWALTLGLGQPAGGDAVHPGPGEPGFLATAPERLVPVPGDLGAEGVHRVVVAGPGVAGLVPAYHADQPFALVGDGLAAALLDLVVDHLQLGPQPFRVGLRRTQNRPLLEVARMCVNPRNANVSGWRPVTGSTHPHRR